MLILSRVCAEFHNPRGEVIFRVTPATRLTFLEAPEEIRSDLLYQMLVADGSLEAVESVDRKKRLEQDPVAGTDASGRRADPDPAENPPAGDGKAAAVPVKPEKPPRAKKAAE